MRGRPSLFQNSEPDEEPRLVSTTNPEHTGGGDEQVNSVDEVLGEIGLVLVISLGVVFAVNVVLVALHIQ